MLGQIKLKGQPPQKRIIMDIEKRLNDLFDGLNNGLVSEGLVTGLLGLTSELSKGEIGNALRVQMDLTTTYMSEGSVWLMGIKRLIDLAKVMK